MATEDLPPGVTRTRIPLLLEDVLEVRDADMVRKLSESPDLGRPSEQPLPFALNLFFEATKFCNAGAFGPPVQWAAPMEGASKNNYEARIADTKTRLQRGFNDAEVAKLEALVRNAASGMSQRDVGAQCAKLLAPLVLPLEELEPEERTKLPDEIAYASVDTLIDVSGMLNPFKYLNARRARKTAEEYVREILPEAEFPIDYVHNLGAAAQGFGQAIMRVAKATGGNEARLAELMANPVISSVGRVVLRETTLDGLLPEDKPLIPGKSMVTFFIGEAFTSTKETSFMFGTGTETRQCPFKGLFLSTMKDMETQE